MREAFVDLQELEAQTIMENPEKLRYSTGTYIHTSMLGLLRCFSAMNIPVHHLMARAIPTKLQL